MSRNLRKDKPPKSTNGPGRGTDPAYKGSNGRIAAPGRLRKPSHRRADLDFNTGDRLIDMTALKVAVRVLPMGSAARLLILEEPDRMPMSEYCVKVGLWFKLLKAAGE